LEMVVLVLVMFLTAIECSPSPRQSFEATL